MIMRTLAASTAAAAAAAADLEFSPVTGHGGTPLVVVETGNRTGPPIVFIHGYSQSYLAWELQLRDPALLKEFHLIAFDLRGHGGSAKPSDPTVYRSEAWAADVDAVIRAKAKAKPVLVPWSYGGPVTMSYVRHHGDGGIAGINFVAAGTALGGPGPAPDPNDPAIKPRLARFMAMAGSDTIANIDATRWFVSSLTAKPLPPDLSERAFVTNMMTPAYVRAALLSFRPDNSDLKGKLTVPILVSHGDIDAVVPYQTALDNKQHLPHATLSTYAGVGHAPFLESPERFAGELAKFTRDAQRGSN